MSGRHLAVEISSNAVRFVSLRDNHILHRLEESYTGKTDAERKEALKNVFSTHSFLKDEFEEVTVAWCIDKSTLVPNSIFNESTPLSLFHLCFGIFDIFKLVNLTPTGNKAISGF